jgi:hypothetical protein
LFTARLGQVIRRVSDSKRETRFFSSVIKYISNINVKGDMSASMSSDEGSINPSFAFIIDSTKSDEEPVPFGSFVCATDVGDTSFVPHYLVGFEEVYSGSWGLEGVWHLDFTFGIGIAQACLLPFFGSACVCVVECEGPRAVQAGPIQ